MKKLIISLLILLLLITGCVNKKDEKETKKEKNSSSNSIETKSLNKETSEMKVIIEDKEYTLNLEDNTAAKTLLEFAPFETKMEELNGNEKYVYLSNKFPVDSYKPGHIEQGDVMLFDTNCLVIFYKSFDTSYSYTKIGHIDNLPDLGNKSINVKFEK